MGFFFQAFVNIFKRGRSGLFPLTICYSAGLPDVNWNSHENLQRLHSIITALKLPPPPPAAVDGKTYSHDCSLCILLFSLGEYRWFTDDILDVFKVTNNFVVQRILCFAFSTGLNHPLSRNACSRERDQGSRDNCYWEYSIAWQKEGQNWTRSYLELFCLLLQAPGSRRANCVWNTLEVYHRTRLAC